MLLPYLTDSLGIAALAAGFIVFAAEGVGRGAEPDRRPDQRPDRRPARPAAAVAAAGRARAGGRASRCSSRRPTMGRPVLEAAWVLVCFLACATAYAFFQVPYVAMPAELTSSYDERTRLMTWRVAILAFTIMLAGATAPLIRDAVGGRAGYRVMGVAMAVVIVVGVVGAYVGTRHAPVGAVAARAGHAARPAADRRGGPRLPAAAHHVRGAGARHRLHARRRRLPRRPTCSTARARRRSCSSASSARPCCSPRRGRRSAPGSARSRATWLASVVLAAGALLAVLARSAPFGLVVAAVALVGVGYAGCQVFPLAMLPDAAAVDARRTGSSGSASTPASGPPARRSGSRSGPACSRWCWRSAATAPAPTATSPSRTRR